MTITPEMKQAFRVAYDFLEEVSFPHGTDDQIAEMFIQTGARMAQLDALNGHDPLTRHLLLGVYDYLGEACKNAK